MIYQFNNIKINTSSFEIKKNEQLLTTEPKVFDLVLYLIQNRERLISRDELFAKIWQGREVSDTSLSNHIKSARKLLGDSSDAQQIIKTIRGRGYQFVATVIEIRQELNQPKPKKIQNISYQMVIGFILICLMISLYFNFYKDNKKPQSINKIAVLPLKNIKPNDGNNYLGFAITDQIIGNLVNLNNTIIRSSASIEQYQDQLLDPSTIGKKLNVDYLIMGSYLKENAQIKLNIELVNIKNGHLVWRESLTEEFNNIFQIQELASQKIAKHFKVRFSQKALSSLIQEKPSNQKAYNYYLQSLASPDTNKGAKSAIVLLKKAIDIDPGFSSYYVELGQRVQFLAVFELQGNEQKKLANKYYHKALQINPNSRTALTYLANSYAENGNNERAIDLIRKLIDLNPQDAQARYSLGHIYRYVGMVNESIIEIEKAINLDPHDYWSHNLGVSYLSLGMYKEALNAFSVGEETPYSLGWKAGIYIQQNKPEKALLLLDKIISIEPGSFWEYDSIASKSIITKNLKKGLNALKKLDASNIKDSEPLFYWAGLFAMLGDSEGALKLLNQSIENGYFNYPYLTNYSFLNSIRHMPEFQEILSKIKVKHENFKAKYTNSN
ncbi:MAG: winged helix-turn-helix domain-containing protein [Colwelliaceae bacterium]|nr:winged helix-turn-helix domain-containing protein [Colwelliaceae bacterium]